MTQLASPAFAQPRPADGAPAPGARQALSSRRGSRSSRISNTRSRSRRCPRRSSARATRRRRRSRSTASSPSTTSRSAARTRPRAPCAASSSISPNYGCPPTSRRASAISSRGAQAEVGGRGPPRHRRRRRRREAGHDRSMRSPSQADRQHASSCARSSTIPRRACSVKLYLPRGLEGKFTSAARDRRRQRADATIPAAAVKPPLVDYYFRSSTRAACPSRRAATRRAAPHRRARAGKGWVLPVAIGGGVLGAAAIVGVPRARRRLQVVVEQHARRHADRSSHVDGQRERRRSRDERGDGRAALSVRRTSTSRRDDVDETSALLFELGAEGVEERDETTLVKKRDERQGHARRRLRDARGGRRRRSPSSKTTLSPRYEEIVGDAWRDAWKEHYRPFAIAEGIVVSARRGRRTRRSRARRSSSSSPVAPSAPAFTRRRALVAQAPQDARRAKLPGKLVLDVGLRERDPRARRRSRSARRAPSRSTTIPRRSTSPARTRRETD